MPQNKRAAKPTKTKKTASAQHHLLDITVPRFAILSIVTLGLYQIYWMYKNWQVLREVSGQKLSPLWRTMLYPIFIYSLFTRISLHIKPAARKQRNVFLALAILFIATEVAMVAIMPSGIPTTNTQIIASIVTVLVTVTIPLYIQYVINQHNSPKKRGWRFISGGEAAVVAAGILTVAYIIYFTFVIDMPQEVTPQVQKTMDEKMALVQEFEKKYVECNASLNERQSKLDTTDTQAVDAYNADVDACTAIEQTYDKAIKDYNDYIKPYQFSL